MKTLTLFALIAVSTLPLTAQDWEPFMVGKTYYYAQSNENGTRVKWFKPDTVAFFPDTYFLHPIPCEYWSFSNVLETYPLLYGSIELPDPLFYSRSDSLLYLYGPKRTKDDWPQLILKPNAMPGDSWESGSTQVRCVSEYVGLVFGMFDSLRLFECITESDDTLDVILSKSHGLIRLPPIRNFTEDKAGDIDPDLILIGDDNSGYRPPKFEDYFDLHAGDLLYWIERSVSYIPVMRMDTFYNVDTIFNVVKTVDSISYYSRRASFDGEGKYLSSSMYSRHFLKNREGKLLAQQPGWFTHATAPFDPDLGFGMDALELLIADGDTVTTACIKSVVNDVDTSDCEFYPWIDNSRSYCFSTPIGLTHEYDWGLGGWSSTTLLGSVINGISSGTVEIPTFTADVWIEGWSVSPNPVNCLLFLDFPDQKIDRVDIYDLNGRLVLSESTPAATLDICQLANGLYVVSVSVNHGNHVSLIVKQ